MTQPLPDVIATERLSLRQPLAADAETIFHSYATDPMVCRYMIWLPHTSIETTKEFLGQCIASWRAGDRLPYVVMEKSTGELLGMLEARLLGHKIDIGYVLARSHWGKGFMPEAVIELTARVLALPEIFRVQATCDVDNTASTRVLEKCGFVREGKLARYLVHPNLSPQPRDCFMYARVK